MTWNEVVKSQGPESGSFLQTTEWGAFQASIGRTVFYIASVDGRAQVVNEPQAQNLDGLTLAILMPISFGKKFLYIPRGPIGENAEQIIEFATKIAQGNNAIFLKIEPIQVTSDKQQVTRSFTLQPERTVILDLTKSTQELLAAMHTKTRYNIALARRHNVRIEKTATDEQFNQWFEMISATARRDGFHAHTKEYYKKLLEINPVRSYPDSSTKENFQVPTSFKATSNGVNGDFKTTLWLAFDGDDLLAGNLTGYFNNTVTYLHGASSNTKRNLMAPFLLHWEIILDAQRIGFTAYDFWGINLKKWLGITRFKQNFGDENTLHEVTYPKAIDIPLNRFWHFLYNLKKSIKA